MLFAKLKYKSPVKNDRVFLFIDRHPIPANPHHAVSPIRGRHLPVE
jgi:hypothetical protein